MATLTGHGLNYMTGVRPFGAAAAGERVGQAFKVKRTGFYHALTLPMMKVGSPTDGVQAVIESDYGGKPAYVFLGAPLYETTFDGADGTGLRTFDDRWTVQAGAFALDGDGNLEVTSSLPLAAIVRASVETGTINHIIVADLKVPPYPATSDWQFGVIGRFIPPNSYTELRILLQNGTPGDPTTNSPEIEMFDFVSGSAVRSDGSSYGSDNILQHNSMLKDTYVPGETVRIMLDLNATTARGFFETADQPTYDSSVTPTTYVGASHPNGWVTSPTSRVTGTRAGIIQDANAPQAGVWQRFAVYPSDVPNTSNTVAAANINAGLSDVTFIFPTGLYLEVDTTYHLYVKRTGSNDLNNHYAVGIDDEGRYDDGDAELWNSTSAATAVDVTFEVARTKAPFWSTLDGESLCFVLADVPMTLAQPTAATVTKATCRKELAWDAHDWLPLTASSNGNVGGTTAVFAALVGYGDDYYNDWYQLLTSGSYASQWRRLSDFTSSSGTTTAVTAYGGQVASAVTAELHKIRPDIYSRAWNRAIQDAYPAVNRTVVALVMTRSGQEWYRTPGEIRDITRVSYLGGSGSDVPYADFQQTGDRKTFRVNAGGRSTFADGGALVVIGTAPLSLLAEDTTFGTLASDSTATLEIQTTDGAWQVLKQYALAHLYDLASQPEAGGDPDDRAMYAQQAEREMGRAVAMRQKHGQPRDKKLLGFPQ